MNTDRLTTSIFIVYVVIKSTRSSGGGGGSSSSSRSRSRNRSRSNISSSSGVACLLLPQKVFGSEFRESSKISEGLSKDRSIERTELRNNNTTSYSIHTWVKAGMGHAGPCASMGLARLSCA